ncbi:hypothetical protein FGK60_35465 [Streptomyces sp. DASNCL29]|nr:hypothetical protein FGK60_35465 [Streptomyces sp. DASNCL29]
MPITPAACLVGRGRPSCAYEVSGGTRTPAAGCFPLPAPSLNWGSAPDPAPQTPEGLEGRTLEGMEGRTLEGMEGRTPEGLEGEPPVRPSGGRLPLDAEGRSLRRQAPQ